MAVYRKNADMAVGNVIGSNIFNLFFILGASATISPIAYDVSFNLDGIILALITAILMILIFVGRRNYLGKWEGTIMLAFYAAYLAFLIYRG